MNTYRKKLGDDFSKELSNLRSLKRILNHYMNDNPIYLKYYKNKEIASNKLYLVEKRIKEIINERVPSLEGEVWRPVIGFETYIVSNFGRVKNKEGHLMTPSLRGDKRLYYGLTIDGKSETIHRMVAKAFLSNPDGLKEVNHKDSNKSNNRADNLEWCTREQNMKHASDSGRIKHGSKHSSAKLTEEKVLEIKKLFSENNKLNRKEIARVYGIDSSNITRLLNGKYWKHVL